MRIPWTLVLVGQQESKSMTAYRSWPCVVSVRLGLHPTPRATVLKYESAPPFFPSLPFSFGFSVIPDLCPSLPSVCRHGNHSSLPPSQLSSRPRTFFSPWVLFTFPIILVASSPSGASSLRKHLNPASPQLVIIAIASHASSKRHFNARFTRNTLLFKTFRH